MTRKKTTDETKVTVNEAELIRGVTYDEPEMENSSTDDSGFYDPEKAQVTLDGLASMSKEVKQSVRYVDKSQIRIIIDTYYQAQSARIALENQLRAVEQGYDDTLNNTAILWMVEDARNRENQIKKMIEEYAKNHPVCRWAMSNKGIGPIFAAKLWSAIDMNKCHHANQFLNYMGQNDNNIPWLGTEKATDIVNQAWEECGLDKSEPVNDDVIIKLSMLSGRKFENILNGFNNHKSKLLANGKNNDIKTTDRTIMIRFLAKPPYNLDLKTTAYLIGEAFVKVSNRGSKYGMLYRERRAWETIRNENLEYREQAERLLSEKNWAKNTPTFKSLSEGKLSAGHINQRAKRWATKIFLTHFFEACWLYTHPGESKPPVIYPIAFQDHVDYIEPENAYKDYI